MTTKKPGKTVDLSAINLTAAADKGAEFELVHPVTSEPLGVFITVLGKDSDVFQSNIKNRVNEKMRKEAVLSKVSRNTGIRTVEQGEAENVELMALCTIGWKNVTWEGVELPFSFTNAQMLYRERSWILEQVDTAVGNIELFFPK